MKRDRKPHIFAPQGCQDLFEEWGIHGSYVHCSDWWGPAWRVEIGWNGGETKLAFELVCTPAQHRSGRRLRDQWKRLWSSWVLREIRNPTESASPPRYGKKVFFGGDTGYKDERVKENNVCPAFKEIGNTFGPFDLAVLPIGFVLLFLHYRETISDESTAHMQTIK